MTVLFFYVYAKASVQILFPCDGNRVMLPMSAFICRLCRRRRRRRHFCRCLRLHRRLRLCRRRYRRLCRRRRFRRLGVNPDFAAFSPKTDRSR